jgi:hypothetical protein
MTGNAMIFQLMTKPWLSEIGLILDLIAFALLSWDLVAGLKLEKSARDDILKIKRMAFNGRYGRFAPDHDTLQKQREDFDAAEAKIIADSNRSMFVRRSVAYVAILLATAGFILQLIGGWPAN